MPDFRGTNLNDIATTNPPSLSGFIGGTLAQLQDAVGDRFICLGGDDRVVAGDGNDTILGGAGNDTIDGRQGFNRMDGGFGIDTMDGSWFTFSYNWHMTVGTTNFSAQGEFAFNFENGRTGSGNDLVTGTAGANDIRTNAGNDTVNGLAGNDVIYGGSGNDRLFGGTGSDRFVFDTALMARQNVDRLLDFNAVDDTVVLENTIFATLALRQLASSAFCLGPAALDKTDRIIYNSATGDIFYDTDGSSAAVQVLFAHVAPATALSFLDFVVV